jgi:hypothetical protein
MLPGPYCRWPSHGKLAGGVMDAYSQQGGRRVWLVFFPSVLVLFLGTASPLPSECVLLYSHRHRSDLTIGTMSGNEQGSH